MKSKYFNIALHILAWSIVLFFPYFIGSAADRYKIGSIPGLYFTLSGIIHIIIFYLNSFFLYPKLLNKTFWWLYILFAILLIIFSARMKMMLLDLWFPEDMQEVSTHILFPSVMVLLVSTFYSITTEKIRNEKQQLDMQLKFLRSQVNPHFLFNILTNLAALARKKSDSLEPSLLQLSGLMRYMLYDAGKKIPLFQEVEYLESYIALQKLRFGREVKIGFKTTLPPEAISYQIEPLLLVPFVENAFKHGTGCAEPFIEISLLVKNGELLFDVRNKFDRDISPGNDEGSGIGLNNVRSRLSLLYPGRHGLVIHDDKNIFSIHLTLKLA